MTNHNIRRILAFLGFVLVSGLALAQTVPPFGPGTLPTAQVWNGYFSTKQDLITSSSVISALGYTPPHLVNIKDYGAVMDGNSHPVSGYFTTAAAAEAVCPSLTKLVGPNVTTGTTNTSATISAIASFIGVVPGAVVTDSAGDIPANTTVSAITISPTGNTITISHAATGSTVGNTLTFAYPWGSAQMDWCAFDAAKNYVVANYDTNSGLIDKTLYVPQGALVTNLPLNMTCINDASSSDGCTVAAHGPFYAKFDGVIRCASGAACIDGLGSRYVKLINPTINGSPGAAIGPEPLIGIQVGRTVSTIGADMWSLTHPTTTGYFALTPFYNFASEVMSVSDAILLNNDNNSGAHSGIFDGGAYFNPISAYVSETIAQYTPQSFGGFLCDHCAFYPLTGNSDGLFVYGMAGARFLRTYATLGNGGACINLFQSGNGTAWGSYPVNDDFDVHCEGVNGTPPGYYVEFMSQSAATTFNAYGLKFSDHAIQAQTKFFTRDANTSSVYLEGVDIRFPYDALSNSTVKLFDTPANYNVSGAITLAASTNWAYPSRFTGSFCFINGPGTCMNYTASTLAVGAAPSANTGTCTTVGNQYGGSAAGTLTTSGVCATSSTIKLSSSLSIGALTGLACAVQDMTTPGALFVQTGYTLSTCTLTVTGANSGSSDQLVYTVTPF